MNTLEHDIFQYPDLSEDEQQSVEERTAGQPEYKALLDEVKRLDAELRCVQVPDVSDADADDIPSALLALYALDVADPIGTSHSEALKHLFADLKERLSHDDALRERLEPMIDRARALDTTFDVNRHLQDVTGIDLDAVPRHQSDAETRDHAARNPSSTPKTSSTPTNSEPSDASSPPVKPADRGPLRRDSEERTSGRDTVARMWKVGRYAAAVVAAVLIAYGGLLAVSMATQSPAERLAVLNPDEMRIEGYQVRTRSAVAEPAGNDERFLRALRQLSDAYRAPLGLFPRFDANRVQEAQDALEHVVENEDAGSFLQLEASFFLAKTYLAQSDIESARRELKRVVMGEGRRIDEATRMLRSLQRHYPMEEPTLPEGVQL
jgi:TolA-binding protein